MGLRWEDIDWQQRALWVRRALAKEGSQPVFSEPKTQQSQAPIALDRYTLAVLRWHRWQQNKERHAWREDHGLVFTATDGSPVHAGNWRKRAWYPTLNRLGLPRYVPHQLRHTHATELLGGTDPMPVTAVSRRLRHARVSTTLDAYSGVISADERRAAEKAGRLLRELMRRRARGNGVIAKVIAKEPG